MNQLSSLANRDRDNAAGKDGGSGKESNGAAAVKDSAAGGLGNGGAGTTMLRVNYNFIDVEIRYGLAQV